MSGIQGQTDYLRTLLKRALDDMDNKGDRSDGHLKRRSEGDRPTTLSNGDDRNAFVDVIKGRLPLVAHVNNAEQIVDLLTVVHEINEKVRAKFSDGFQIRVVIAGGAEAWLVADELVKANVEGVILSPLRCTPEDYDSRRCGSLSSLQHPILLAKDGFTEGSTLPPPDLGIATLLAAGIRVAIASNSDNDVGSLAWEAGWAQWMSNRRVDGSLGSGASLSTKDAIGTLTWNLVKILHLVDEELEDASNVGEITLGSSLPNLVVYDGNPLENFHAKLLLTVGSIQERGRFSKNAARVEVRCFPVQI